MENNLPLASNITSNPQPLPVTQPPKHDILSAFLNKTNTAPIIDE